ESVARIARIPVIPRDHPGRVDAVRLGPLTEAGPGARRIERGDLSVLVSYESVVHAARLIRPGDRSFGVDAHADGASVSARSIDRSDELSAGIEHECVRQAVRIIVVPGDRAARVDAAAGGAAAALRARIRNIERRDGLRTSACAKTE